MGKAKKEAQKEITLEKPGEDDHRRCVKLRNASARFFFAPGNATLAGHRNWYGRVATDPSQIFYVVKLDGDVIGTIGLSHIDYYHKHAEYGQFVIGEEWRGNGYGRRALCALLRKAFGVFGLHRVCGRIFSDNVPARLVARSIGFTDEGLLRQPVRRGDEFIDVVCVAILAGEFDDQ